MRLKTFTTRELYYVLDANHAKEILHKFGEDKTEALFDTVKEQPQHKINILSRSLFSAITDGPSSSLVILWSIIGLVTLNVFALSMLTCCFAILLLITGGMFFYGTYKELNRENKKSNRAAQLAELKLLCANEIYHRQKYQLKKKSLDQVSMTHMLFNYKAAPKPLKHLLPHLKRSIGAALIITPTLFGTYYFAASGILGAFGLTTLAAFMTGPIGISIAIAVALAIGIYFGYKLYQACKAEESFNDRLKKINREFEFKRKLCYEQKNKLQHSHQKDDTVKHKEKHPTKAPDCTIRYAKMPVLLVNRPVGARKRLSPARYYSKISHSSF